MEFVVVCAVALGASCLTLISGFGLGTLLLPAFAAFFPLPLAVGATAAVHLANNLFKLWLVGRHAHVRTVLRFGISAAAFALLGALTLRALESLDPIVEYVIRGRSCQVTWLGIAIGMVMAGFAAIELTPRHDELAFPPRFLPVGGAISGFFGGLCGHQGAFRSAFLIRCGLTRDQFIGTGVVCAVIVDVTRISTYAAGAQGMFGSVDAHVAALVVCAAVAAFAGAVVGARLMKKITLASVRRVVGVTLMLSAIAVGAGVI